MFSSKSVTHLAEKLARVFHFEHVRFLRLLEDGNLDVALLALQMKLGWLIFQNWVRFFSLVSYLSLASGDEDVDCEDLMKLKVELVVLLPLRLRRVLNNNSMCYPGSQ